MWIELVFFFEDSWVSFQLSGPTLPPPLVRNLDEYFLLDDATGLSVLG